MLKGPSIASDASVPTRVADAGVRLCSWVFGHSDIAFLTPHTGSAAVRADAYRGTMNRHGLQDYIRVTARE